MALREIGEAAMGSDYLQLFDRRTAEVILGAAESELAALVDLRGKAGEPPVWNSYWDPKQKKSVDLEFGTKSGKRLQVILESALSLKQIKEELLEVFCIGAHFYLDYWGCWMEVFSGEGPAGAVPRENFMSSLSPNKIDAEGCASGRYLLKPENVEAIRSSLEMHRQEWSIMNDANLERLRGWQKFCVANSGYCVLYQMDF